MLPDVEHVLDLAYERVDEIEDIYNESLSQQNVSGKLQAMIRSTISDYRSALEFTVNAIAKKYAVKKKIVYWPNAPASGVFHAVFDSNLPGLRTAEPDIANAFERVQSYQRGYEWVADLMALYRGNQHHVLTPQTRTNTQAIRYEHGGARIQIRERARVRMSGAGAGIRLGGKSIREIEPERLVIVDWLFDETGKSAFGTLKRIRDGIRPMVHSVSSAAGL